MEVISLSKQLTSLEDISLILQAFRRPTIYELDNNAFKALLKGFQVIVTSLENDKNSVDLENAVEWLRLYLKARMVVVSSDTKLCKFSKTVPIAITYIFGWLQYAPSHKDDFFNEVLNITYKLVFMTELSNLKKLEEYGQGVISLLWHVIDKTGLYNIQLQALQLFIKILQPLDKNFTFWEVQNIPNVNNQEIIYKILELLRTNGEEDLFKKLARSILNQHNLQKNVNSHVLSFYCKTLEIGNGIKFLKGLFADRFWLDMNIYPRTLSFEGRFAPKHSRKYENVNVSLNIKEINIDKGYLYIRILPPAKILGAKIDDEELNKENFARIALINSELTRFVSTFSAIVEAKNLASIKLTPSIKLTSSKRSNSKNEFKNFLMGADIPDYSHGDSLSYEHHREIPCLSNSYKSIEESTGTSNQQPTTLLDEYEDVNVSDAEPCQSYRTFQTRKFNTHHGETLPMNQAKKRTNSKSEIYCSNMCKTQKQIEISNWESCNLKKIPKYRITARRSLLENEFDKLKNETPSETVCVYNARTNNSKIEDQTHMDSSNLTTIESIFNSTIDNQETQIKLVNPRTPKRYQNIAASSSTFKLTKSETSFISCESNQAPLSNVKKTEDFLVYHKRSDNDTSSDDSELLTGRTLERTPVYTCKRTAKKRLFDLDHSSIITDSDTDYNVTEFVYVGKKDYLTNMSVINTAISSMFQTRTSSTTHRVSHKVRVLADQEIVELEKTLPHFKKNF